MPVIRASITSPRRFYSIWFLTKIYYSTVDWSIRRMFHCCLNSPILRKSYKIFYVLEIVGSSFAMVAFTMLTQMVSVLQ
jgi:hypothetical protein